MKSLNEIFNESFTDFHSDSFVLGMIEAGYSEMVAEEIYFEVWESHTHFIEKSGNSESFWCALDGILDDLQKKWGTHGKSKGG